MTEPIERVELRNFALTMAGMVALLFGALMPWLWGWSYPAWPWYSAISLAAWGLIFPLSLKLIYRIWMGFGHALGWINTRLILGIVFFVMIAPVGVVMRLFGWDPMRRRLEPTTNTYRAASKPISRNNMKEPY